QRGEWSEVTAIASRDASKAERAAGELGIPKAYGSYEALLADPDVDAVYNPLPNHLHVGWSVRAAGAGKHVLCEKPLGVSAAEARELVAARDRTGVKVGEAFMVRTHPQWVGVLDLIAAGRVGDVRSVAGYFSYNNADPHNIRNVAGYGGGALMDIGCYLVYFSRLAFGAEPARAVGLAEVHPETKTDVLTSAILEFPAGHSVFTCSTRVAPYQRVQVVGTRGRIEVVVPVNTAPDRPTRVLVDDGSDPYGAGVETLEFAACDQYTIQGDLFSRCVLEDTEPPVPLEESVKNMAVIDAIFRSAKSGGWETIEGADA
ncbi:MAG TPA: Gfo/Idh/MocA family oxidoreductase, partial [Pyrinomonadaceae bacterium]